MKNQEEITRVLGVVNEFNHAKYGVWVLLEDVNEFVSVCEVFGLNPSGGAIDVEHGTKYFYK